MTFHALAFDLDDTLLDTTGLLVPRASKHAFEILQKAGLRLTLDECENLRLEMIKYTSHKEVFRKLALDHGSIETQHAVEEAIKAFYHPAIPEQLPLLEGAYENLTHLHSKYALYIVTAGFEDAQNKKIEALQIKSFFKQAFIVNSLKHERKYDAFKKILELEKIPANQLLCIGNSLSSEIKDARLIGAGACYFEHGEDRGAVPHESELQPHFHIRRHDELIRVCQL